MGGGIKRWAVVWHCLCDPMFIHFSRTLTCNRQRHTDTQMTTAYSKLVDCHVVKTLQRQQRDKIFVEFLMYLKLEMYFEITLLKLFIIIIVN